MAPPTGFGRFAPSWRAEAVQLTDDADWEAIAAWCDGELRNESWAPGADPETALVVEGDHAWVTDWVVKLPLEDDEHSFTVITDEDFHESWDAV